MKTFSEACEKIKVWRREGFSYDQISKMLMENGYPTVTGRKCWNVGTVWKIAKS